MRFSRNPSCSIIFRFVYTLTRGSRSYLEPTDFHDMLMDIIHTHPGLAFYREATEFHEKYCQVVQTRIFWNDAHSWSGKLTTDRLRKGGLLQAIRNLAFDDDINKSLRYFRYVLTNPSGIPFAIFLFLVTSTSTLFTASSGKSTAIMISESLSTIWHNMLGEVGRLDVLFLSL